MAGAVLSGTARGQEAAAEVGFRSAIAPILKARCAGCHHPGKAKGGLDLSTHAAFRRGGSSGPAFVAGSPSTSLVVKMISGSEPEMPAKGSPLRPAQIALISQWIAEGARDNGTAPAGDVATTAPAVYQTPPPTPAIAFSPGGDLLAVAGYHEVLLYDTTEDPRTRGARAAPEICARLVGKAPRIQSIAFSDQGRFLAVAGGTPGVRGEIQIWNVAERKLHRVFEVGTDTTFGVSFDPKSTRVAVGCADRTVRVLRIEDGEELLRFKNHAEWVLGTCFTRDGKQVVSGSRDKALKIIDLSDGRFVDDINSPIDPILGLVRHPTDDKVLYAGALGTPRLYKISDNQARTSARNDTNLLRAFARQRGPVHAVAFRTDGEWIAAGGADSVARVHDAASGKQIAKLSGHTGPIFAIAFRPAGPNPVTHEVVTAGFDGTIRWYDAQTGALRCAHPATPTTGDGSTLVTELRVEPGRLRLSDAMDARRVLVQGVTPSGKHVDLTGESRLVAGSDHVSIAADGYVVARRPGNSVVRVRAGGLTVRVPVTVVSADVPAVHFAKDVMPVLSRAGCNAGTCHGAQDGKNGFALSLRGFDIEGDFRALIYDLSGRRFDRVHPERSLMLQKPTAQVPHEGQQVIDPGSRHYEILRRWIAEGSRYQSDDRSAVVELSVLPARVDLDLPGEHRAVLVIAHYADGATRDVTREAHISVSDIEVAAVEGARVTGKRRGESSVLIRYEGRYATAPITVMGDRTGFVWSDPKVRNFIDSHVHAKLRGVKVLPSETCTDAEFVRRLYLNLTGKPPSPELARRFVKSAAAADDNQSERDRLIDELIGSPEFVDHWANKWADLLQCNSETLGEKGVWVFRRWIAQAIAENRPYDEFVKELVTASGSTHLTPATNYMRALSDRGRTPDTGKMTEDITQTFLGVRFGCCKCHNHPFERWTQDQYYEVSALFSRVRYKKGREAGEVVVFDSYDGGEAIHPRTSDKVVPAVPYGQIPGEGNRRERLAEWLTEKNNALFARSYVNRVWSYFFGKGIIEPVDDIRAGNPPSNPQLLAALEDHFVASGFDFNDLVRTICRSATWQRSFRTNRFNADDTMNFARAVPRRLSAEQLLDAVAIATGVPTEIKGLPKGSRSVEAPDGIVEGNDFLKLFGRPKRESACECARTSNLSLAHALNLVGGTTLHDAIVDDGGRVARLIASGVDDRAIVTELYWAALSRPPSARELAEFADLGQGPARLAAAQDLLWALTNSPAFLFNR